jgi:cell division protein ZapA (FtsZ GTPase activity inhibitor)
MGEKQTQTITIDDKEYNLEDLSNEAQTLIAHVNDLDRKINSTKFNLDQLNFGRSAVVAELLKALPEESE